MPASKKVNLGQTNKVKPAKGMKQTKAVTDFVLDVAVPKTPSDVAWMLFPYGKAARAVGGIAGKGKKFVGKVYRNMGK